MKDVVYECPVKSCKNFVIGDAHWWCPEHGKEFEIVSYKKLKPRPRVREYRVMLSITLLETHYVGATSKDEAIAQAMRMSYAVADGGDAEVFEVGAVT